MSDTSQLEALTRDDLLNMVQRDQFVKEQLSARVAALMRENLELIALLQDQQRQNTPDPANNGEVVTAPLEPDAVIS